MGGVISVLRIFSKRMMNRCVVVIPTEGDPTKKTISIQNRPIPRISDEQVLIRMSRIGICGSDVHWACSSDESWSFPQPMVLGHESAGVIAELGSKVTDLAVGDRVAIEPGLPCKECSFCLGGRYNLCQQIQFCATPPVDGNMCEYFAWDPSFCYKLPANMSLEEGALLEPLSVAVHANRRSNVALGSNVLILGSGPIGLVCLEVAKTMGAAQVVVTDVQESRLAIAAMRGASTVNVSGLNPLSEGRAAIKKAFDGSSPTSIIECSGAPSAISLGVHAAAPGATMTLVGMGPGVCEMPLKAIQWNEVDIRGLFRYANTYPVALQLVSSGRVSVKDLVTHRFKLDRAEDAFELFQKRDNGALKIVICADDGDNSK